LEPISESKGKPGGVTEITTEQIPGGAIVNFRIPNAEDILSVKAVYTLTNGKKRESITSYYGNQVVIEGFNDMVEHEALFYTINRAQVASDPVSVKFTPLESPLSKSVNSASIIPDFGGVNFSWRNEDNVALTYEMLAEDEKGNMQVARIMSSKLDFMDYTLRGFLPELRKFAMVISDNFGNVSDTLIPQGGALIPLREEELDKSRMAIVQLGSDVSWTNWDGRDYHLIDGNILTMAHSPANSMPGASFTIDLGAKAKLSRFLIFQRQDRTAYMYGPGSPENFEVYACFGTPSQSGDWSEWTKVLDCRIIKPSGLPLNSVSDEDVIAAIAGHEFSFSPAMEPVRYLRYKFLNTWDNNVLTFFAELTPFGYYE
jgi:hypothetical protein